MMLRLPVKWLTVPIALITATAFLIINYYTAEMKSYKKEQAEAKKYFLIFIIFFIIYLPCSFLYKKLKEKQ